MTLKKSVSVNVFLINEKIKMYILVKKYFVTNVHFVDWRFLKSTGIDLNLQYPAGWENAKRIKFAQGFDKPAPRDYVGKKPLEAKEAIAIYNFTKKHNFEMVIAYHTQGKEIYWKFGECTPRKSEKIGKKFSEFSGYKLADVPYNSSFAGYKDWFIQEFNKPGYTIEAGIGENPIQMEQFEEIWKDNFGILGLGIEEIIN